MGGTLPGEPLMSKPSSLSDVDRQFWLHTSGNLELSLRLARERERWLVDRLQHERAEIVNIARRWLLTTLAYRSVRGAPRA